MPCGLDQFARGPLTPFEPHCCNLHTVVSELFQKRCEYFPRTGGIEPTPAVELVPKGSLDHHAYTQDSDHGSPHCRWLAGSVLAVGGLALATATPAAAGRRRLPGPLRRALPADRRLGRRRHGRGQSATGLKYYTLAFLTPQSGCTPEWEDGGYGVGAFTSQISSLQNAGGNVIISFGGADGGELAQTCTYVSSLTAAYPNVVNTYGVTRLDFDIEGGVLSDTGVHRAARPGAGRAAGRRTRRVQVDFTLAVDPTGLPTGTGSEYALLQDAKSKGVKVNLVNIMTMDFGDGQNAARRRRVRRAGHRRASWRACTASPPRPPTR